MKARLSLGFVGVPRLFVQVQSWEVGTVVGRILFLDGRTSMHVNVFIARLYCGVQ